MLNFRPLSPVAHFLLRSFTEEERPPTEEHKITVNPIVSKFASWYERLRNTMEFREDEVVLRATIERILKRRLLLGGNGKTTAIPLVKELLWARYLPDNEVGQSIVEKVEESIDLYLALRLRVMEQHKVSDLVINDWIYDLMSSDIQYILNPKRKKEVMTNFMFHVLRDDVSIVDDSPETKDAQVFMAVRRAFAKDDLAFLRYHLFCQYFGRLTKETLDYTADHFLTGYHEIIRELSYPLKDRIYTYVKRRSAAFIVLEDILNSDTGNLKTMLENAEELEKAVFAAALVRYNSISSKVKRAVVRSVLFILLTKVGFAFAVEGTYEKFMYGHVIWSSMALNIAIPPILMIVVSLFICTPKEDNTRVILEYINQLLYHENPQLGNRLITVRAQKKNQVLHLVFDILWLCTFVISFGGIVLILTQLQFNIVSQFIFTFFLAIVSFLAYRISMLAGLYRVGDRQGLLTLLTDFLFMPIIKVGSKLTQSIRQINIFLYMFDFFIEAPFKLLFAFFDQWFYYLHAKTEELE
ncbi:hypothetical protein HY945_05740 [Candidatus Gottesmanbacteria bacterium]|nr:hypothetical protein [Candidatus Gottesmanbacteria bacterium]